MTYDQRKHEGIMCCYHDCAEMKRLHKIVRTCDSCGNTVVWRYCDSHITRMMSLAMSKPGLQPDGTYSSEMICTRCWIPLTLILE